MNEIEKKLKELSELSNQINFVNSEFQQKLYGSCPDGDVTLAQMINFIRENSGLLEMIIDLERKIK